MDAQQIDFERLILHGMLSLLLFAGAFLLDFEYLSQQKLAVGLLAVLGTLLSILGVGIVTWWVAPWTGIQTSLLECLLFGSLISPTDPIAVLEMLRRVKAPKHLEAQLAGESLFNDGIGAVVFLAILAAMQGAASSPWNFGLSILTKAGDGILLGISLAVPVSWLMCSVHEYQIEILLTLALALGGYSLADSLGLSAPLEVVSAGIALRRMNMFQPDDRIAHKEINHFWSAIDEVQNAILFVLLGCEVLIVSFQSFWIALGISQIAIVNLVRVLSVVVVLGLLRTLQPKPRELGADP